MVFVRQFDFAVIKQEFFLYVGAFFDKIIDCSLELRCIYVRQKCSIIKPQSLKSKSWDWMRSKISQALYISLELHK